MEFVIPLQRSDLETVGNVIGQYVVEDVLSVSDIAPAVTECIDTLSTGGHRFILKRFDILYSCICKFSRLKSNTRSDVWKLMLKAFRSLVGELSLLLDENNAIDEETRCLTVNVLKMNSYILCQLTMLFEDEESKATGDVVSSTNKGRASSKNKQSVDWDWTVEKQKVIIMMRELFALPLRQAWSPPVIEEEFLNLFCDCCYKMLEKGTINRTKELKDSIFHLLGSVIQNYKNTISGAVKIVQLLQQYEHLAVPLAHAIIIFVKNYDINNILNQIIREIGTMEAKDFAVESLAIRSFSAFLIEITQHLPSLIVSNIAILSTHLDEEPYGMRNCVLGIMGEILLQTSPAPLSDEGKEPPEMDERARMLRDQFLDHLEAHIHDINAFVRSRALAIWTRLFQEKAVPIDYHQSVLKHVVGRLEDKSCIVRKNAIILITAILRSNPFGAHFSLKTLTEQYNKEMGKLKAMCVSDDSSEPEEDGSGVQNRTNLWTTNEAAIKGCLDKMITRRSCISINIHPTSELVVAVQSLINAGQYQQALSALSEVRGKKNTSNGRSSGGHVLNDDDSSNSSDASNTSNRSVSNDLLNTIRNIYIGGPEPHAERLVADATNVNESGESNRTSVPVNMTAQKSLIKYLKDSIRFARIVNEAMPLVCKLLHSVQTTDVLAAVEFFVLAFEFGMQDAMMGIRKMLALIWSKDAAVKETVVAAYKRLYIVGEGNAAQRSETIAKTFINLVKGTGTGQRTALEEMICEFVRTDVIPARVYKFMWILFANRSREFTLDDSNAAIVFLGMAAGADKNIIHDNLLLLVSVGLGDNVKGNFQFVKDVCSALLKLHGTAKPSIESKHPPPRMPPDHIIFQRLSEILVDGLDRFQDEMYIPMAEQVIIVIYNLAERPDVICGKIIVRIVNNIIAVDGQQGLLLCPPVILARFITICGQIALHQMIHLDVNIFTELKRRRHIAEETDKKNEDKKKRANKRHSLSANAALASKEKKRDQSDTADDDCGMTGATADDTDADCIQKVCEKDLVTGNSVLASIAPLIVTISSNPGQFQNKTLQAAACLALAKYMMVSSEFCNDKMQLLITILEKSQQSGIRANTIVALCDLCCRFPNIVEPWTSHLYARLSDRAFDVRRSALLVLTHLVLHDMIKVKGQISELALCAIDEDEHIADQAKYFFVELSQKANSIFNLMPEIITRLSDLAVGTTEEKFHDVMEFILPFVQKERLVESLVEKLLHRFPLTRSERQWRDLAFCMPILCRNPKCYIMVLENMSFIADKLCEPTVYAHFSEVIAFAKKNVKPESQATVDELEGRINEYHRKGVDEEAIVATASHVSQKLGTRSSSCTRNARSRLKASRRPPTLSSADDSNDDLPLRSVTRKQAKTIKTVERKVTRTSRRKRATLIFSSDSESDVPLPSRKSPTGANVNVTEDSSDTDY